MWRKKFHSLFIHQFTVILTVALLSAPPSVQATDIPANFRAGWVSATSILLQWDDVSGESKYELFVNGALHANIIANQTARQVSQLTPLTNYSFSIRSCTTNGSCSGLAALNVSTAPPLTPANLRAVAVTSAYVLLNWDTVPEAASYRLYNNGSLVMSLPGSTTGFQVSGLAPNTSYLFEVQGCVSTGCGGSASISVITRSCVSDSAQFTPLISEGNISGEINQAYIFNGWQSSPWWGISMYRWWFGDIQQEKIGSIVSHLFTNPGSHQVFLRVEDFCGHTSQWIALTAEISNPSTPQSCPGNNPPVAQFDHGGFSGHVGTTNTLQVSSSYDPDGQVLDFRLLLDGAPISAWQITPYINHTWNDGEAGTHSLQVQARDRCGVVTTSNPLTVTIFAPLPPVPSAPSPLAATAVTSSSVALAWTNPAHEDEFVLKRDGSIVAILAQDQTAHLISGLLSNTTYNFSLQACNASGCSEEVDTQVRTSSSSGGLTGSGGMACPSSYKDNSKPQTAITNNCPLAM